MFLEKHAPMNRAIKPAAWIKKVNGVKFDYMFNLKCSECHVGYVH